MGVDRGRECQRRQGVVVVGWAGTAGEESGPG